MQQEYAFKTNLKDGSTKDPLSWKICHCNDSWVIKHSPNYKLPKYTHSTGKIPEKPLFPQITDKIHNMVNSKVMIHVVPDPITGNNMADEPAKVAKKQCYENTIHAPWFNWNYAKIVRRHLWCYGLTDWLDFSQVLDPGD